MKRVLVTGATGFIGRQTLPFLLGQGYEVHAAYSAQRLETGPEIIWHKANLLDPKDIDRVIAEVHPTHLLHFAWYVNPKDYKTSPENERWRIATLHLLEAFKENDGVRAVFAGSAMEYDPTLTDEFIREEAATAGHNAYATAKIQTHADAASFSRANGISFSWGRIFNLYGPHEARERLVSQVILSLLANKAPVIPTGGLVLDYSYVKDTAGAFVALLESDVTGAVNVASGNPISLRQMAVMIAQMLQRQDLVRDLNDAKPPAAPMRVVADIHKLQQEVKWGPRFTLEDGLRETIEWWKGNGDARAAA